MKNGGIGFYDLIPIDFEHIRFITVLETPMYKKSIFLFAIIFFLGGCNNFESSNSTNNYKQERQSSIKMGLQSGANLISREDPLYAYIKEKWDEMDLDYDQRKVFLDSLVGRIDQHVYNRTEALKTLHKTYKNYPLCFVQGKVDSVNQKYGLHNNQLNQFTDDIIDELISLDIR